MGANAVSQGSKVALSDLDALYLRLYNLRNTHASSNAQLNASALTAAQQSSGLSQGDKVAVATAKIDVLKSELKNLANSQWYKSGTANEKVSMTDFSENFTVPSVGDLLKASDFNLIESTISTAETIVPNYSNKYGTCYSNCYSNRYGTCYSNCYSNRYGGQYGTCYSVRYGTCYSTRYSTRYGTCYGRYSQYSGRYSRYATCYSNRVVQIRC